MKEKRTMTHEQIQDMARQIADFVRELLKNDQAPIDRLIHESVLVRLWEGHPKNEFAKETTYVGYRPVRAEPGDWKYRNKKAWNKRDIWFPDCQGEGRVITYWAITTEGNEILYWGKLKDPILINTVVTAVFRKKDLTITGN